LNSLSWINSAVCTKTLKGFRQVKISKQFKYFWFPLILWVYSTRKTCVQHWFISLNIYYNDLGHPKVQCYVKIKSISWKTVFIPVPCSRLRILVSKGQEISEATFLGYKYYDRGNKWCFIIKWKKKLVAFCHRNLTLKVQFLHILRNLCKIFSPVHSKKPVSRENWDKLRVYKYIFGFCFLLFPQNKKNIYKLRQPTVKSQAVARLG
jgi:hypothetical protein